MLEINNLYLNLGDKEILHNINLELDKRKIYGLIGPNGVGKTSLIKCLVGIYDKSNGDILYDGEEVYNNPNVKKRIAYVADENIFLRSFTVKDIIKYYKLAYDTFNEDKFHNINKIFNIPLNKKGHHLSKGMNMKVSLMFALSQDADYIILDEPTSGLDPIIKKTILNMLVDEVSKRNITIIISSHNLNEIERICDDIIILDKGQVLYKNKLEDMKKRIKKIQVAFDVPTYEEDINIEGIFKMSRVGRVFTIITSNYSDKFIEELNKFKPLFIEEIDLTLEDIFLYKLNQEDKHEEVI